MAGLQDIEYDAWWQVVEGAALNQGDWLEECYIPVLLSEANPLEGSIIDLNLEVRNVIVLTQSCDLENGKAPLVAVCPIYRLSEWEETYPEFAAKGRWESVRQGRIEGLHLLAGIEGPQVNTESIVVDFRQIYSLPIIYLANHAGRTGKRSRLHSPYLEHFAQAFARFFMRVGLPSNIARF